MRKSCAVILAGGDGKRMKSDKPKVMAEVLFKPMIDWVTDAVRASGIDEICVVTGNRREIVEAHLSQDIVTAYQAERLGTGHAVMQARSFLEARTDYDVLILAGDAPFIDDKTINLSHDFHNRSGNDVTVISADIDNPKGYGRIVRNDDDTLLKIVEERDASDSERLITEVNSGAYWFCVSSLISALDDLVKFREDHPNNAQEYYLTDAIEILTGLGQNAAAYKTDSSNIVLGANNRSQLAALNEIARADVLEKLMEEGVSIPFTQSVVIGPDVVIGRDSVILPGTMIFGKAVIGSDCVIGPDSYIDNCMIKDGANVRKSDCADSVIGENSQVGPFARLRPNTVIESDVRIGNFVEVKNSSVGNNTKISHLSYIGDAELEDNINIGSGCATVNYSGKVKSKTVIKSGAFVGCDTSLIAPVTVGERAYIAAGSTITEDIPDNSLALARARQVVKRDWVLSKNPYKR